MFIFSRSRKEIEAKSHNLQRYELFEASIAQLVIRYLYCPDIHEGNLWVHDFSFTVIVNCSVHDDNGCPNICMHVHIPVYIYI